MVFMSRMGTMRTSSTATAGRFALPTTLEKAKALVLRELNFYRVHVLAFTFVSHPRPRGGVYGDGERKPSYR